MDQPRGWVIELWPKVGLRRLHLDQGYATPQEPTGRAFPAEKEEASPCARTRQACTSKLQSCRKAAKARECSELGRLPRGNGSSQLAGGPGVQTEGRLGQRRKQWLKPSLKWSFSPSSSFVSTVPLAAPGSAQGHVLNLPCFWGA